MKNILQNHIDTNFSFLNGKKMLLATSGGLDSMVMVDLFHKLSFDIAMAHCNFQLRGLESFGDQKFVQDFAEANKIELFLTQFDTEAFAKAVGKGLADKYPQIAGLTVTIYTSFNNQATPQYVTTLTRLAPTLTPAVKAAVTQRLADARSAQSRIVR